MNLRETLRMLRGGPAQQAPVPPRPPRRSPPSLPQSPEPVEDAPRTDEVLPESGKLEEVLDRFDCAAEPSRSEAEYTHLSSLIKGCPRQIALEIRYQCSPLRPVNSGDRLIWVLGKAAEHHARTQLTQTYGTMAYGDWTCACRKEVLRGRTFQDVSRLGNCAACGHPFTNYVEHVVKDEERRVKGSPDFLLRQGQTIIPVEFKSKAMTLFKQQIKLPAPEADHATQVLGYARILRRMGFTVPTSIVIYVCKDFEWGLRPYKEYRVTESGATGPTLDVMDSKADTINAFRNGGPLPPRLGACPSPVSTRAKSCSACSLCFSAQLQ